MNFFTSLVAVLATISIVAADHDYHHMWHHHEPCLEEIEHGAPDHGHEHESHGHEIEHHGHELSHHGHIHLPPAKHTVSYSEGSPVHCEHGEHIVHKPAPIIVKRPPTKILVNHPPVVVHPSPVVLKKPAPKIIRPKIIKKLPRKVSVHPIVIKVKGKPQRKVYIEPEPTCADEGYDSHSTGSWQGDDHHTELHEHEAPTVTATLHHSHHGDEGLGNAGGFSDY